jgi:hypothetical protein
MKVVIPMRKALADPQVLAHALPGKSWMAWRTLLIAIAGERLNAAERKIYKSLTSRPKESGRMVDLFLGVIGRRGGKSKAAAVFMTWLATCCDWTDVLSLGERGIALIIAPTERQARVTEDYIRAIIDSSPLLASLIEDRTTHVLTLSRQVGIEVLAANAKTVRGITAIGVCLDESAFLPSNEDSANSDLSLLQALRPTVSSTSGVLFLTSSPDTMTGIVYHLWKRHYGPNGSPDCLVVQSATIETNPKFQQSAIDKAFEEDAESAQSEYGGQFREPMSQYLSRAVVEACVEKGVTERNGLPGINYQCRLDAAGGSGADSFAGLIAHRSRDNDRDLIICDVLYEVRPPFDPLEVIAAFAGILKKWNITQVTGDGWAFNFVASAFAKHGITYHLSKLSASELYIAALPAFTSKSVVLLDQPRAIDQLCNLRRKVGSAGTETVTHMSRMHDDLSNCIAGGIHLLTPREQAMPESWDIPGVIRQPRVDAYSSPDTLTDSYMRSRGFGQPTWPTASGIHSGPNVSLKNSPTSRGNAIW